MENFTQPHTSITTPPNYVSAPHDLLSENRPVHSPLQVHGFVDSDWASCPKTRRSLTGVCLRLAGGTIAYKTKLQPTIAQSKTEAEFILYAECPLGPRYTPTRGIGPL